MKKLTAHQKAYFNECTKGWKALTEAKEHTLVRKRIALFLGVVTVEGQALVLARMYDLIYNEQERVNYLSKMMRDIRSALDEQMDQFIKEQLGEEMFKQIHECL